MTPQSDGTIVVVDLAGTHRLFEQMGQGPANRLIGRLLGGIGQAIEYYNGTVVKTVGDEIVAEFAHPDPAIATAIHVQREMHGHKEASKFGLAIRVGIHHGPVTRTANDVFGSTVVAARGVTALAKREQILLPRVLAAWSSTRTPVIPLGRHQISGIDSDIEIVSVDWPNAVAADLLRAAGREVVTADVGLDFAIGSQFATCDAEHPELTIGRKPSADIILGFAWVSRDHIVVSCDANGVTVTDSSRNGTWIYLDSRQYGRPEVPDEEGVTDSEDRQPEPADASNDANAVDPKGAADETVATDEPGLVHIKNDSVTITGSGWLGVGRPESNPETMVRFGPVGSFDAAADPEGGLEMPPT